MMINKSTKHAAAALVLSVAFVLAVLYAFAPQGEATAESGIGYWRRSTIADGTTSYTGTQQLGGVYVADYGSVQIQLTSAVSDYTTSTVTLTPQFSVDAVDRCSEVTNWFDASAIHLYNAETAEIVSTQVNTTTTTVITNSSTITQEVGYVVTSTTTTATPTLGEATYQFGVTGNGTAGHEVPSVGVCMRVKLSVTNSDTYTPTVIIRAVDRN